ncbi:MAG: NYN domain-containing protein [Halieaceae bacterium]
MSSDNEDLKLALFCDFENVALGVRDANYAKFDIQLVLEQLLLKGTIVVKKAYCDWERYKEFKPVMHDASFELIEIPHTRQSGKNSADIRMVVDALDLCYTKEHIDTFVVISGDSDFSPLVSKLRENAKLVVGVGVKNSTSDLLMNNCDEFIFYDDLVRDEQSKKQRRKKPAAKSAPAAKNKSKKTAVAKPEENTLDEAITLIMETAEALYSDQGGRQKLWGSMVKQAIKRRRPGFNERFYGVRGFGDLLEEAESRGLLTLELDERSGGYIIKKLTPEK